MMKKKYLIITFIMSLVLSMVSVDTFQADANEVIVVLDPGHDSKHSGAGSYGLREE